jgi:two-component system LytT family response regulator
VSERRTALLVEDEPEALLNLRDYLREVDWIEVVGEARDGSEAIAALDRLRPDLLFLDVQLPELDGLEVLRRSTHAPHVVFTTAFDQHAVAAFELGALDYLVKPFGRERFLRTLARARERLAPSDLPPAAERARRALSPPLEWLFARQADRIVPIAAADVRRVEACGDYARVIAAQGAYLLHVSLRELEAHLDPGRFVRLHRSHLVRLDAIRHLASYDERRLVATLVDGTRIVASRAASERLRREAR